MKIKRAKENEEISISFTKMRAGAYHRRMRTLILMAGVPGSGKSSWAKRYAAAHPNSYVVDTDEVRRSITGDYRKFTEPVSLAWDEMIRQANELLAKYEDVTVIIDSTFLNDERRLYFLSRLKGYDRLVHYMVKYHDYSEVFIRNKQRPEEKWVPEETIRKMIDSYVDPSPEVASRFDEITVEYFD